MGWLAGGIGAILLVLFLWIRKNGPIYIGSFMTVHSVGPDGTKTFLRRYRIKKPKYVPHDGLSQIAPHVERVFASSKPFTSLRISPLDAYRGLSLYKSQEGMSVNFIFKSGQHADLEARTREFFDSVGNGIRHDYLAGDGETRILSWWVSGNAIQIAKISRDALRTLSHVTDEDGLSFAHR